MKDLTLRGMPPHQLVQSRATSLKVESNMVHSCYVPLSKTPLEWHININDVTKRVETEQAKIMQARLLLLCTIRTALNAISIIMKKSLQYMWYQCFSSLTAFRTLR